MANPTARCGAVQCKADEAHRGATQACRTTWNMPVDLHPEAQDALKFFNSEARPGPWCCRFQGIRGVFQGAQQTDQYV